MDAASPCECLAVHCVRACYPAGRFVSSNVFRWCLKLTPEGERRHCVVMSLLSFTCLPHFGLQQLFHYVDNKYLATLKFPRQLVSSERWDDGAYLWRKHMNYSGADRRRGWKNSDSKFLKFRKENRGTLRGSLILPWSHFWEAQTPSTQTN